MIQFVTQKNKTGGYRVVAVRDANVSDQVVISYHETLPSAHMAWRELSMLPNAPWSNEREAIFNHAKEENE